MHEMSLMADLMRKIEQVATENNAQKVKSVTVWIGALEHISADHFRDHFAEAARGTVADTAVLHIITSDDIHDPHARDILLKQVIIDEQ